MPDRWKQKFFDALEQSEATGRALERAEDLLRLTVSRLTVAADGVDPELDQQLQRIRRIAKKSLDPVALTAQLEDVSRTIYRLDSEASAGALHRLPASAVLAQLLQGIELPRKLRREGRAMERKLRKPGAPAQLSERLAGLRDLLARALATQAPAAETTPCDNHEELAEGLRELVHTALRPLAEAPEMKQAMAQMERSHSATQLPDLAATLAAIVSQKMQQTGLQDPEPTRRRPRGNVAGSIAANVEQRFLQFVEMLDLDPELRDRASALRHQLQQGVATDCWVPVLSSLADLVTAARDKLADDREDLTGFLQELTSRLQEIDQSLVGTERHQIESLQSGVQLAEGVRDDLGELKNSATDAGDLSCLKQVIESRTEGIYKRLREFRDLEQRRHARWSADMDALKRRVNELESASATLQQDLDKAQSSARLDALTGLLNRRAYDQRLAQEVSRSQDDQTPLSLVMCDIDRFKSLNDRLGHQAGDKVLQSVAEVIKKSVRKTDIVARYGGEEFVVLLPESDGPAASVIAEQIRHNVETAKFRFQGAAVPVTISCGYAQFSTRDSAESVFKRADRYLYAAKEDGRNRVAGDPVSTPPRREQEQCPQTSL